jgi:alpha-soluble NSF attachment protein
VSRRRAQHLNPRLLAIADNPWASDKEAGAAFEEAAKINEERLNEPDEAANIRVDAFKVYRKDDPERAVSCMDKAILRYTTKGNFRRAASHKENVAELIEVELHDRKKAMGYYQQAAKWYEDDGAKA